MTEVSHRATHLFICWLFAKYFFLSTEFSSSRRQWRLIGQAQALCEVCCISMKPVHLTKYCVKHQANVNKFCRGDRQFNQSVLREKFSGWALSNQLMILKILSAPKEKGVLCPSCKISTFSWLYSLWACTAGRSCSSWTWVNFFLLFCYLKNLGNK